MNTPRHYRGWSITQDKWIYGNYILWHNICGIGQPSIQSPDPETGIRRVDPASIGQWTGLKDRNGKEIFEGDVAAIGEPGLAMNCLIGFHEGCYVAFVPWVKDKPNYPIELKAYSNDVLVNCIEVVGNAWEHPELIKEVER